jgi:hypothetical protein
LLRERYQSEDNDHVDGANDHSHSVAAGFLTGNMTENLEPEERDDGHEGRAIVTGSVRGRNKKSRAFARLSGLAQKLARQTA